jgi:hypothetical protein
MSTYCGFVGEIDKVRLTTLFIISAEKTFVLSSSFLYPAKTYLTMVHKYFLNKEVYMPVKKVVASKKVSLKAPAMGGYPMCPINVIICLAPCFVYRQSYLRWWICVHSVRKWKIRDNWAVAPPTLWPARWNFWKERIKFLLGFQ